MPNNYTQQVQPAIDYLRINNLTHAYVDCPVCGGTKKLSISILDGKYIYNCFKNSCDVKGIAPVTGSIDDIHTYTRRNKHCTEASRPFDIPTYLIEGVASQEALNWLVNNHAIDAYKLGYYELYTDVREDRICIPLYGITGTRINLGGRDYLGTSKYNKFKIYNRQREVPPFIVGRGSKIVIVEDFASAAHVAVIGGYVGYALLGTQFNMRYHLPYLRSLSPTEIVVALDKDALKKGVEISKSLTSIFKYVRLLPLSKDIKNMETEELLKWLM